MIRVEVRLFATLTAYLPSGSGSPALIELPEEATVEDLARLLHIPEDLSRVVLVNGEDAGAGHRLRRGDRVSIFPPLAGGGGGGGCRGDSSDSSAS